MIWDKDFIEPKHTNIHSTRSSFTTRNSHNWIKEEKDQEKDTGHSKNMMSKRYIY